MDVGDQPVGLAVRRLRQIDGYTATYMVEGALGIEHRTPRGRRAQGDPVPEADGLERVEYGKRVGPPIQPHESLDRDPADAGASPPCRADGVRTECRDVLVDQLRHGVKQEVRDEIEVADRVGKPEWHLPEAGREALDVIRARTDARGVVAVDGLDRPGPRLCDETGDQVHPLPTGWVVRAGRRPAACRAPAMPLRPRVRRAPAP